MFDLARLKVRGFRGFVREEAFEFDHPIVMLFGENDRGKSSTLNAVEWCLFGEDCVGKKTGIPERINWEVANRYAREAGVAVEAEFNSPDGTYLVTREATGAAKGALGTVTLALPDGTTLHGEDAERRLSSLFRSSFRDFMTTVYQHQESIRAILTEEPRERNDAIDRLLGLSQYRELLKGIRAAEVEKAQKTMENDFENFRGRAEQSIRTYDNLIREEKAKAMAEGLRDEDIAEQEALRRAKDIGQAVQSLAQDLDVAGLKVTLPQSYHEVADFRERVKKETDDLWAQAPLVANQEALAREQQELSTLKGSYDAAKATETTAHQERATFVRENGDEAALAQRLAEEKTKLSQLEDTIRDTNKRANLVREAIEYLSAAAPPASGQTCPLCFNEVPDLLAHLESEWRDKISQEVDELERQRAERTTERARLESLRSQLADLEDNLDKARSATKKCVGRLASVLGREIGKQDDPGALANTRLSEIALEQERISQAIEQKRNRISGKGGIYDQLATLRTIDDIVNYEGKRAAVEELWDTKEFAELDELRDLAAQLVEDVEAIRSSLAAASREEAEAKIHTAGAALDEYFRLMTKHPAIRGLDMDVTQDKRTGLNSYAFKSKDGTAPIPILNQAGLNSLALSLFLGLARATGDTQPFSFLMLDDPAQSFGSEAKRRLVDVLEGVASWRKLIIATPDTELKELLTARITKSKTLYTFADWTEKDGSKVARAT